VTNQGIFEELKKFIPSALSVIRIHRRISRKRFALKIKKDVNFVRGLEEGRQKVSFVQLEYMAGALRCSVEKVLKLAQFLKEGEELSEDEVLEEVKREAKYQIWALKQR